MPHWTRQELASALALNGLFWMMSVGAPGLVIGPGLGGSLWFTVPGLVLHLAATGWLVGLSARSIGRAGIEATAPQALIYGWVLQFAFALLPYFVARYLAGEETPRLGGNWFSVIAVNVGSGFVWASIFITTQQPLLHGTAYISYTLAMVPVIWQMTRTVQSALAQAELAANSSSYG